MIRWNEMHPLGSKNAFAMPTSEKGASINHVEGGGGKPNDYISA